MNLKLFIFLVVILLIFISYFLLRRRHRSHYEKMKNKIYNPELLLQNSSNQQDQITLTNSIQSIQPIHKVLILFSSCDDREFKLNYLKVPVMKLSCDQEKKEYQCKESGPYIKFIIDNYDIPLAEIYLFIHGHSKSWHYIQPIERMIGELYKSNNDYLSKELFGGIECVWNYCPTLSGNVLSSIFVDLFKNTSIPSEIPNKFSYPCCSSFFVSSNSLRIRSKDEYIALLDNMEKWSINNYNKTYIRNDPGNVCGRVYEMMWNRILSSIELVKTPPYCKSFKNEIFLPLLLT